MLTTVPTLQHTWGGGAHYWGRQASEECGNSSFGSSFLGLGNRSQPEDFVIRSLFLGALFKETAVGPGEKGAVFGPLGLTGGWEAVSTCPQGYNGRTQ